jgi:hypothetical protein
VISSDFDPKINFSSKEHEGCMIFLKFPGLSKFRAYTYVTKAFCLNQYQASKKYFGSNEYIISLW